MNCSSSVTPQVDQNLSSLDLLPNLKIALFTYSTKRVQLKVTAGIEGLE